MSTSIIDALVAGLVDPEEAKAIVARASRSTRAAGPRARKNKARCQRRKKRPDECQCDEAVLAADAALDKAVLALGKLRSRMSAAERSRQRAASQGPAHDPRAGETPLVTTAHAAKAELEVSGGPGPAGRAGCGRHLSAARGPHWCQPQDARSAR